MMAEVPSELRDSLRTLVIAVAARDGRGLVEAAQQMGVLLPTADTGELERALTQLFARFGGMSFTELRDVDPSEFRDFAREFGDMIRALPFQLPEHLLLLIRAVSLTSGLCTSLDRDFNIWDAVQPYATRLLREESTGMAQQLARQAVTNAAVAWRLPTRVDALITRMDRGSVTFDTSRLERRLDRLERIGGRVLSAVLFAALLIGGALLTASAPVLGTILVVVSFVPLLHALLAGVFGRGPR